MSDVPDWAWKVGGVVLPALCGLLFRSEKIQGDRCGNCDRSTNYQVVGGITRGIAIIMGIAPVFLAMGWVVFVDPPGLPLWTVGVLAVGALANEVFWLRIARNQRNGLKCLACGDVQPIVSAAEREDCAAAEAEATEAPRRKRKRSTPRRR